MSLAIKLRKAHIGLLAAGSSIFIASAVQADHSWGNYHWARTSNPFTVKLGDNLSGVWDSFLQTTSNDWNVSTVLDTTIVAGGTRPRQCRSTKGRIEVCNASYGNTGWLGVASISVNGSHITAATVKLNDTYFNTAQYNTTAWRNLVSCQEVGHGFGLDHQDEVFDNPNLGTCMDYTNSPNTNQHPNAHDYEQLLAIYNHADSTTTVGATTPPPAMESIDLASPGQWGRVIQRYPDGRPKRYELDFGRGHKIITHVYWVPGEGPADEQ